MKSNRHVRSISYTNICTGRQFISLQQIPVLQNREKRIEFGALPALVHPARCLNSKGNRRVMLLANFRVVRAAYEGLKAVLPKPSNNRAGSEDVHEREPMLTSAPFYSDGATLVPTDARINLSPSQSCGTAYTPVKATTVDGIESSFEREIPRRNKDGEEPEHHGIPQNQNGVEGTIYADEADNEEACRWYNRGAAEMARREERIVRWALRDAAARVVQEETRSYARRRRWLSGLELRQGTATTDGMGFEDAFYESSAREDEGRFEREYQAEVEGLPWVVGARLSTAVTTTTNTATTKSSTRDTTARTTTASMTATASSAIRSRRGGGSGQSTSYHSNRSPLTVDSAVSPTWCVDNPDDCNVTPEPEWGSEGAWEGGRLHTQQEEVARRRTNGRVERWPLLPSEELKKR